MQGMRHIWRNYFPLFHAYTALILREMADVRVSPEHTDTVLVSV